MCVSKAGTAALQRGGTPTCAILGVGACPVNDFGVGDDPKSHKTKSTIEISPFHSSTEGVGGFQRDTTAVMALPSMVTTTLKGVVIQSWQSRGRGGVKETT